MELGELVNLPNGVLLQEWIASHTLAFFEHINLIYGTISEFCTMSGCSEMCGPGNKLYMWTDERGKRSKVPAPQYIDYVMTYMQKTLNDESIFPTKQDKDFPTSFDVYARKVYRLLFHVLAHIYHMHFNEIVILDLHKHLNCIFAHLILFNQQFNLIDSKELDTLNDLSIALKLVPDNQTTQEPMQTSTPEPPSLPTSLNLTSSIEQYVLDNSKDLQTSTELHQQMDLQTSSSFNQPSTQETGSQRKKHSRQHSYTASQTISSPTNYIKRFISSFSPNNQTNSSTNQSCAINEETNSLTQPQSSANVIAAQCKGGSSPFSSRNDDLEQNDLLNSDQENQHDLNKSTSNQKIALHNKQPDSFGSSISSSTSKTHKYQHSTPIFFSSSFFSSRTNATKLNDPTSNDSRTDETNVQLNEKVNVIKENTKLLNSDRTDDYSSSDYGTRRTTSASAIYLTQQSTNSNSTGAPSIFTSTATNLMSSLNEEHLTGDYSLDDQTTTMSCNQSQLNDSNPDIQMDTSSTSIRDDNDESDVRQPTFASNRTFGNLELDENEFDSSDNRTSSNRRNVCALVDSN